MKMKTKRLRVVAIVSALLMVIGAGLTACSDDDPDPGGNFTPGGGTDTDPGEELDADVGADVTDDEDVGEEDVHDPGDPCDGVTCGEGEYCEDGDCVSVPHGLSCEAPHRLALDGAEGTKTVAADPSGETPLLNTNCSEDGDESPQSVFAFSVDEPMRMNARISESNHILVKELRVGTCDNRTLAEWCSFNEQNWFVEPDTDYYLIVEANAEWMVGPFELELEWEELVCSPPGEWGCDDDVRTRCWAGEEVRYYDCATGCNAGECLGDSCQNPIELHGSMSVEADLNSYDDNINFEDSPSCSTNGSDGPSTTGKDMVFHIPDVSQGQRIEVTAPSTAYAIGIMDDCVDSGAQCVAGDDLNSKLEWTADAAGDYYIVVDHFTGGGEEQHFSIEID